MLFFFSKTIFKEEIEVPTPEEIKLLFELSYGTEMYLPIRLAAMCGLRRSELCALQWSDVDFKNKTLSINQALVPDRNENYVLKSTKSRAGMRKVRIPEPVLADLKKYRGIGPVVTLKPGQISRKFYEIRKKHFKRRIRLHDLRHYYASIMLLLGIPDKYAMKFIGHSTPDMLKRTYQHIFKNEEAQFLDRIDDYFSTK